MDGVSRFAPSCTFLGIKNYINLFGCVKNIVLGLYPTQFEGIASQISSVSVRIDPDDHPDYLCWSLVLWPPRLVSPLAYSNPDCCHGARFYRINEASGASFMLDGANIKVYNHALSGGGYNILAYSNVLLRYGNHTISIEGGPIQFDYAIYMRNHQKHSWQHCHLGPSHWAAPVHRRICPISAGDPHHVTPYEPKPFSPCATLMTSPISAVYHPASDVHANGASSHPTSGMAHSDSLVRNESGLHLTAERDGELPPPTYEAD
ncbi:hypothetical protein C8R43DRAFT_956076 [Mycena crocata]|nr:hypothetical protein C8R43DRAFT_956076 [Mycena crocata]